MDYCLIIRCKQVFLLRRSGNFQDMSGGKKLCRQGKRAACTPATGLFDRLFTGTENRRNWFFYSAKFPAPERKIP
jgi:hypothetical protein